MSDSVQPHKRRPTRLPSPWDSPGKNMGVGCHFLLQCRKVKSESKVAQSCLTLSNPMDYSLPGSSIHGIFQARVLEWGAIAFSSPMPNTSLIHLVLFFISHTAVFIPMPKNIQTTIQLRSVFLPGKSHGQRSLVGCSPWGREE